jgi:hypothetical protein
MSAIKIVTPTKPEGVVRSTEQLALGGIAIAGVDGKMRMRCPCCDKRILVMPVGTDWAADESDLAWLAEEVGQ